MKVLFVCTGNMCRSPMAMFMLRSELEKRNLNIDVDSAGTMRHEKPMTGFAVNALKTHNVSVDEYVSKFVDKALYDSADFVFVMTNSHRLILESMYGENKKVIEISRFLGREVADPYGLGEDAYSETFKDLSEAIPKIADFVKNKQN